MKKAKIYVITNKINSMKYVGLTVMPLNYRLSKHISDSLHDKKKHKGKINKAIIKYGKESFDIVEIEEVEFKDMYKRETYWISKLDTIKNGYNIVLSSNKDEDQLIQIFEEWLKGETMTDLAIKYNVCRKTLGRYIKDLGLDTWANHKYTLKPEKIPQVKELYKQGKSIRQISKELKMCRKTISSILREVV